MLHFCCFSAKNDDECLTMLNILSEKVERFDDEFVLQKNSDGLTAVCFAAQRSFQRTVVYLLNMYKCSEQDNACDIELEYGVRSNNSKILDKIYEKHKNCHYQVHRNEKHP